jgi:5'(3')-deoxyribonucleotidase
MMREPILIDCDGILSHFTAGAIRWATGRLAEVPTEESITQFDIMKAWGLEPDSWASFAQWLTDTDFCRDMPVYDGSQAFVEELRKFAKVICVTSPFESVRHWEHSRRAWLKEHYGFTGKEIVSCSSKELIPGAVLIDDRTENLDAWWSAHPDKLAICFSRPWNRSYRGVTALSYAEALELVKAKFDAVRVVGGAA